MDDLTIIHQNVRSIGVKKVSPSGQLKLNYLFSKIPQKNCILILSEVNLQEKNLKALNIKVPPSFKIVNCNFSDH